MKGKLVRDNIPNIIREQGKECKVVFLSKENHYKELINKLKEEVEEFLEDGSFEELIDIFEVVISLSKMRGKDFNTLICEANDKRSKMGGFNNGIYLLEE